MSTTTTTNYGWTIPNDDELVKNGAAAIRTLGQAIDTTAAANFTGGLALLNTTNFSAVSSVSVNDVFTSTYSNYRIILTNGTCASTSGVTNLDLRLRASGADNTSANYGTSRHAYASGVNVTAGSTTATSFLLNVASAPSALAVVVDFFNPEEAQKTAIICQSMLNQGGTIIGGSSAGQMTVTTSYTGFTFLISTGNFSGDILVYGYKK